tara:strand:- start:423 stop:632 length:210 start_codon:yes stop_codon:yes gene_type:complete
MKAKEEAKQLVNRFIQIYDGRVPQAKQCALICIDEMIREIKQIQFNEDIFMEDTVINYWNKVKKEINKL